VSNNFTSRTAEGQQRRHRDTFANSICHYVCAGRVEDQHTRDICYRQHGTDQRGDGIACARTHDELQMAGLTEKLQHYKSAMEVAAELAGIDADDVDIESQVEAFERKFQEQALLEMGQPVPETKVRSYGLRATVAPSAAAAAAAAATTHGKDAEDGGDDAHADRKHHI
jgi:hypothetical protein